MKKRAFTLAETLITLLVIGVVAALTIPSLMQSWTARKYVSAYKKMYSTILNGFTKMVADENITGHDSTEKFVQEMRKYFSISKICGNEDLANCFAEKIITEDDEIELSKLKKSSNLGKDGDSWPTDTNINGILLNDGTSMLIAYNKDGCKNASSSNEGTVRNCVAIVFDLDGPAKGGRYTPLNDRNEATSDIGLFNAGFNIGMNCGDVKRVSTDSNSMGVSETFQYKDSSLNQACMENNIIPPGYSDLNEFCTAMIGDQCEEKGFLNYLEGGIFGVEYGEGHITCQCYMP